MSTKLKAGTATSGAVIDADTSGILELVSGSSSQYTATVPQSSGTVMVSGNMPAFSAYQSSAQAISNATFTKAQFQTKEFDTNNYFDNTTNYRFTPLISGYYQVSGAVNIFTTSGNQVATIYKNGSRFKDGASFQNSSGGNASSVSALIYFNGSTDYVELYCYQTSGSAPNTTAGAAFTYFQASMVRAA